MIRDISKITFLGKRDDEVVTDFIAKHWIVEVPIVVKMLVAILFFIIIFLLVLPYNTLELSPNIQKIILASVTLILAGYFAARLIEWMDQLLDVLVLTNKRLISFEQEGLFKRISKEMNLRQIEDVQAEQFTWRDNLFKTGKITITNKSESVIFYLHDVAKPHLAKRLILDARDVCFKKDLEENREAEAKKILEKAQDRLDELGRGDQLEIEKTDNVVIMKQIDVPDPDSDSEPESSL